MKQNTKKYYVNKVDRTKLGKEFDRRRKLTEEQKREIKARSGEDKKLLAAEYEVTPLTIYHIHNPEKLQAQIERRKTVETSKEVKAARMRNYRRYKRKLIDANVL